MKLRNVLTLAAALVASAASAQLSVTSTNLFTEGTPALPGIYNQQGVLLGVGTGTVGVGSFNISDSQIASLFAAGNVDALAAAFIQLGSTSTISGLGGGIAGATQTVHQGSTPAAGLGGDSIYTVISTGSTLFNAAAQLLVFKHAQTFLTVEPPAVNNMTVYVANGQGTLIVGQYGNYSGDLAGLGSTAGFNTVVGIPEPSAIALLGLGALAGVFIIRRRR